MINTTTQLDFFNTLYKDDKDNEERNKNVIRLIKNLKYLRANMETKISMMEMRGEDYRDMAYAVNKVGHILYYLAMVGFVLDRSIPQSEWMSYTHDKGTVSSSTERSGGSLYDMSISVENLLKGFKMRYLPELKSKRLSRKTMAFAFESLNELKDVLCSLK